MKMLAGTIAALALVGATSASAQIVYPGAPYPAPPAVVVPAPAPRIVAPAPYVWPNVPGYIPGPYPGSVVVGADGAPTNRAGGTGAGDHSA
jgi:hypothetical protein